MGTCLSCICKTFSAMRWQEDGSFGKPRGEAFGDGGPAGTTKHWANGEPRKPRRSGRASCSLRQ